MHPTTMRAAQQAYDDRAPDEAPDGWLSEDDAKERARDELLTTPVVVAQWLGEHCEGHHQPINAYRIKHGINLSVPQLLAVAFGCDDAAATQALHQLRERFLQDNAAVAAENAAELLAAQDAAYQRAQDRWAA